MATEMKRLTFAVTPTVEKALDEVKRELYDTSQSEILRYLVMLGVQQWRKESKSSAKILTEHVKSPLTAATVKEQ